MNYYYKDKKLALFGLSNFFKMEFNYILMKSHYRRVAFAVCILFLIYYFYSLLNSYPDSRIIIDREEAIKIENEKKTAAAAIVASSSLLIDAIVPKEDPLIDSLPIHTLVSPYKVILVIL